MSNIAPFAGKIVWRGLNPLWGISMNDRNRKHVAKQRSALRRSLLITAVYTFIGYVWIIGSEIFVTRVMPEPPEVFMVSIIKGLAFVTATAVVIFVLVYSSFKRILHENNIRLKNEIALEEAQRLAHIGSISYDLNTKQFDFSDEALHILGLTQADLPIQYDSLLRIIHIHDREPILQTIRDALSANQDASFLCRVLDSGGMERSVQVHFQSSVNHDDEHHTVFCTLQDLTDRVRAESAARENEAIYKALINSSYDLVYLKDSSLRYIAVNTNMQRYYGLTEEQLQGKMISEIKPGSEANLWEARDRNVLISGTPLYIEDISDKQLFETIIFPVDMSDHKRGVGGISRDITQRRKIEAEVIQERDKAKMYFEIAPILFVVLDKAGKVMLINRAGTEILGLKREEIIGKVWNDTFVPEQDRAELNALIQEIYSGTIQPTDIHENGVINAEGEIRQIEWRNTVLRDANGETTGMLSSGVDVTDLRQIISALRESERSKSVLLSNLPGMAYRCAVDRNWTMSFVSSGCFELTGYKPEELIDNKVVAFNDIICPEYRDPIWDESVEHIARNEGSRYEYEILTASGERKWVLDINESVLDSDQKVVALEGIIIDITRSKLQFLQIQYLSNHDQLTGLHNRQHYDLYRKKLDQPEFLPLSVFFVDINGLKLINDAFGYDAGDRMIQTTAAILKQNIMPKEILSRIGGDEFGIIMPNTSAIECAERMQTILNAFEQHNESIKDKTLVINLSVGYSTKEESGTDLSDVEKNAESNMARHKLFDQKSHHNAVLSSIMTTLFERSYETEEHAERIGAICGIMAEHLGLTHEEIDKLHLFAILHDIGKIGISDQILNKPSSLTEEETAIMRKHPEIGYRIAMASPDFASVADLILTHQERWDGTGYPNHLSGEQIPLLSRILAVADAYDAMTEDRVYRKALPREVALSEIRNGAGTQFDPRIAAVFLEIAENNNI